MPSILKPKTLTSNRWIQSCCLAGLVALGQLAAPSLQAQGQITFDHLNAGAVGTDYGDKLIWANGGIFSSNSGYVLMNYATSGTYAGYYNSSPTMTVLAATAANSGPVALAPALGSYLQVIITLISAPEGGKFSFWLTGATTPSFSLNPGESTSLINLTSSDGAFGADPFGHIHGRRFGATTVGDYIVGLQLFDTSDNGLDGLPIHAPSDLLYMDFRAAAPVPEPGTAALIGLGIIGLWLLAGKRRPRGEASN